MIHPAMDDLRFGAALRAARVRRGWRQADLAAAAGVSESTVSRIERGAVDRQPLRVVRAVAAVLEVSVDLVARSRAGSLERIANAAHSTLAEQVVGWLTGLGGWAVRLEVSFSRYGERGIIDILAWHEASRSLLVIELKTELVDIGELLGTLDRKVRNARVAAAGPGWVPSTVSTLLVIGDSDRNRRRVTAHVGTFRASFPDRVVRIRSWLREPSTAVRGLVFFADRHPRAANQRVTVIHRVRRPASSGHQAIRTAS